MGELRQGTLDLFLPEEASSIDPAHPFRPGADGYVEHPVLAPGRLRAYPFQMALATEALGKDLLVVLPTGLGKTVIAALVAAEVVRKKRGKVLLLAPTKPLVVQHARSLEGWFRSLRRAIFTGEVGTPDREGSWGTAQAVFATPQVVLHDLLDGLYSLRDVGVIIFDEAHHARGKYAYTKIAAIYHSQRTEDARVLALTASPGDPVDLMKKLQLAGIESRTREDPDVGDYVRATDASTVKVPLAPEQVEICGMLREAARVEMVQLQRYGLLRKKKLTVTSVKDLVDARKEIWARPGSLGLRFQALSRIGLAQHFLHSVELVEREGLLPFLSYAETLDQKTRKKLDRSFLSHPVTVAARERARNTVDGDRSSSHPKLEELTRIVSEELAQNPQAKILVFAEYRDAVRVVTEHLRSRGVRVESFVGQASRSPKDPGMAQKRQISVLQAFRTGSFPVLVASRVAEEGLDIPQVDIVVEYDVLSSHIRTTQRRGRTGRTTAGRVITLMAEGTKEEAYRSRAVKGEARLRRSLRKLSTR